MMHFDDLCFYYLKKRDISINLSLFNNLLKLLTGALKTPSELPSSDSLISCFYRCSDTSLSREPGWSPEEEL